MAFTASDVLDSIPWTTSGRLTKRACVCTIREYLGMRIKGVMDGFCVLYKEGESLSSNHSTEKV